MIYYHTLEQRKMSNCTKGKIEPQHIFLDNESVKAVIAPFFQHGVRNWSVGVSIYRREIAEVFDLQA